jgi:hypothetical protein
MFSRIRIETINLVKYNKNLDTSLVVKINAAKGAYLANLIDFLQSFLLFHLKF